VKENQTKSGGDAPDFARETGAPTNRQLTNPKPTPASEGQVKQPSTQGGRSEADPKS
jgi:hypothetical protein